jgi:hypothetical protein
LGYVLLRKSEQVRTGPSVLRCPRTGPTGFVWLLLRFQDLVEHDPSRNIFRVDLDSLAQMLLRRSKAMALQSRTGSAVLLLRLRRKPQAVDARKTGKSGKGLDGTQLLSATTLR